jgi:hypothetical protein
MYPVVVALLLVMMTGAAYARHPLEPADTSSLRATMDSFLSLTQEAARHYQAYLGGVIPR